MLDGNVRWPPASCFELGAGPGMSAVADIGHRHSDFEAMTGAHTQEATHLHIQDAVDGEAYVVLGDGGLIGNGDRHLLQAVHVRNAVHLREPRRSLDTGRMHV